MLASIHKHYQKVWIYTVFWTKLGGQVLFALFASDCENYGACVPSLFSRRMRALV